MQVQLSIEMRAGMAEASKRLGMSQLALIRSAISAFLLAHEGTAKPPVPTSETPRPDTVPLAELEPPVVITSEQMESSTSQSLPSGQNYEVPGPTIESEMSPVLESDIKETTVVPEQTPAPKRSRAKKAKAQ